MDALHAVRQKDMGLVGSANSWSTKAFEIHLEKQCRAKGRGSKTSYLDHQEI
jgi:hypothetical protein